jgi:hypothetical protein
MFLQQIEHVLVNLHAVSVGVQIKPLLSAFGAVIPTRHSDFSTLTINLFLNVIIGIPESLECDTPLAWFYEHATTATTTAVPGV